MATSLKNTIGGSGGLIELTTDPNYAINSVTTLSIPETGTTQNLLVLSGRFAVPYLRVQHTESTPVTIRMIVDGVEIFNESAPSGAYEIYGGNGRDIPFLVKSSLTLEYTGSDTGSNITLSYLARPIV